MKAMRLSPANVNAWIEALIRSDRRVIGPVRAANGTLFSRIEKPEDLVLETGLTIKSAKGVFFPQSEVILKYEKKNGQVRVEDVEGYAPPTVLLGVRPCDAAAMAVLDSVFSWDTKDPFFLKRRENTTIVSLGCSKPVDEFCFCTSVGLGPQSREGSDVFMLQNEDGGYYLEAVTEKGEALLSVTSNLLEGTEARTEQDVSVVPVRFAPEKIKPWLDEHFEDDLWKGMSIKCIGCGTCTFICPTCHCFDIVDETRLGKGVRRKNWDSCQFGLFTKHASGHNPRGTQGERYRQRIMHKFKYYEEKFGRTLCVGCGRCVRACPVGHSLLDYLEEISRRAEEVSAASGE